MRMNSLYENIDGLDVNPRIVAALKRARLTDPRQLLTLSNPDIERLSNLQSKDVQIVKDQIAKRLAQHNFCNVLEILHGKVNPKWQHWKLPTNCKVIDKVLRGGLLAGVITEISGESACGKTQLCLQLCISVQLMEQHGGGAVYICTEDVFPSKRLQQLIQHYSSSTEIQNLGDKIYIEHVADFETLDFCVTKKLPALLNSGLVHLVIIDSVTALFRCHYEVSQTVERAKHLTRFASLLHQLAFQHNIPIVCVNQVSANMAAHRVGEDAVTPALGLTWANQITCRLTLSRPPDLTPSMQRHINAESTNASSVQLQPTYRIFKVVFSPHVPKSEICVHINHSGMHGIPP